MKNNSKRKKSDGANGVDGKALLQWHRLHEGLYARVAQRMGVDPSYVSRIATGQRKSDKIQRALVAELDRIHRLRPSS